jgi:hypothetical protein
MMSSSHEEDFLFTIFYSGVYFLRKKMNSKLIILLLLIAALILSASLSSSSANAQGGIELGTYQMSYTFDEVIHFEAEFQSNSKFADGHIVLQTQGENQIESFQATISTEGFFSVDVSLINEFKALAFSDINFWYLVATEDGTIFESQTLTFAYEDNRFQWQNKSNEHFKVVWHSGDEAFGDAILFAAENGIRSTQRILPIAGPDNALIYVYEKIEDLDKVMDLAGFDWVAAHSDLEEGSLFLSIAPSANQSLEIERQVPHEVAHLMLYRAIGDATYRQLPRWLNEGIASNAELYSDPIQTQLLELAYAEGSLPSFYALCESFPQDVNLARIAYAESASFVEYLNREYRVVGIGALIDAYALDGDCGEAPKSVFGKNLSALENDWRKSTFGISNPIDEFVDNLSLPNLIFYGAIIVILIWIRGRRNKIA